MVNFDLEKAEIRRKLQIDEIEELIRDAYDNAKISKERVKIFHNIA